LAGLRGVIFQNIELIDTKTVRKPGTGTDKPMPIVNIDISKNRQVQSKFGLMKIMVENQTVAEY
jgi:hypothetical protein